jgi:enoyl-CoA hydratase/carnithine racemase
MNEELIRSCERHVTRLTLNRPHKANALDSALIEALLDAVEYAYTDGTRLLVLEGRDRNFSAGFDFTGYQQQSEGELVLRFIRIETLLQRLYHAPFATLALAHGRNFGAGVDIIGACSLRIAAPDTTFRMPGLRFGVVLGTRRLAARVGTDKARELLAGSRTFGADEALGINFITGVAEPPQWPALITQAAADATALPAAAAAALARQTLADTRADDMAALVHSVTVPGLKERIRIFRESK